jgi:protein-L-isoaspartate(D-aspartate) O-methyltransferase
VLQLEKADWGKLIDSLIKQNILQTPKVIKAMRTVPRTKFLPSDMKSYTSTDTPLPIGCAQTISAPHIVSMMNEALQLEVGHKVLEIGTGSGWHAATIAEIVAPKESPRSEWGHVYSIEFFKILAENARKNIMNAGYGDRITTITADGSKGYPEKAPFDRILATASTPKAPKPLFDQMKRNGIIMIPVGSPSLFQNLMKFTKQSDGKIKKENLGSVTFVPLAGKRD